MAKELLTSNNTVFFSSANDSYVFQAATSLLSIRQFQPNAELYILSKHISNKNKKLLRRHSIKYIELDLTYLFFQIWQYPTECYYIFAGPEIFKKLGYKYSVYIDGDVLCLKNPLDNCPPINDIGGVHVNTFNELFGPDKDKLIDEFGISPKNFSQRRIHSGIIYMNNNNLSKLNFLQKSGDLYYRAWKRECPRKGDDSLFALFQLVNKDKLSPTILEDKYNYIPHYKGFKINKSTIFFHFTLDKPWKPHPYQHKNKKENIYNHYLQAWRKNSRKISFIKWFNTLSIPININNTFTQIKKITTQAYFASKGIRYPVLKKRKNIIKPTIKLYWWEPSHINNFGDTVSKDIIFNIFGFNTIWEPIETCDLIATGSIIEIAKDSWRGKVLNSWGSGFISEDSDGNGVEHIKFYAVRGEKTLSRIGYNVPTSDPGILINSTYLLKKKRKTNKIGVVIHYADIKADITKKFCEDPRFEVITPLDSPKNVAQKISECSLILSSSLHGLIFADSLEIPNAHIKISNNLTGGIYKFIDYYSGVGKTYKPADIEKVFNDKYLNHLKENYEPIPNLVKKQKSLIKSFSLINL